MDVRLFLRLVFVSTLVVGSACNDESLPQRPVHNDKGDKDDDDDDDDSASTKRDAGKNSGKDAGKDAGTKGDAGKDAGKKDAEVDDETGGELIPDAGPKRDAGGPSATPVGRDAGMQTAPTDSTREPTPTDTQMPGDNPTQMPPTSGPDTTACASSISAGQKLFSSACNGCHSGALPDYPVIDPANLGGLGGAIKDRISRPKGAAGAMPMGRPLPADQQQVLVNWIDCL